MQSPAILNPKRWLNMEHQVILDVLHMNDKENINRLFVPLDTQPAHPMELGR